MATKKSKKNDSKVTEETNWMHGIRKAVDLTALNLITALLYIPFAILLLGNGDVANWILGIITVLLMLVSFASIAKFLIDFGQIVDPAKAHISRVPASYLVYMALPIVLLKVYWYVLLRLMPQKHEGLMCDLRNFVFGIDRIFTPQYWLTWLLIGSAIAVFVYIIAVSIKRAK